MQKPSAGILFAASLAILLAASSAEAQNRTTGGTGGSSLGGGSSFGSSFGGSSFGGSSFGSGFGSTAGGTGQSVSPFSGAGGTFGGETSGQQSTGFFDAGGNGSGGFFGTLGQTIDAIQRSERAQSQTGGLNASGQRRPEVRVTLVASPELKIAAASRTPRVRTRTMAAPRLLRYRNLDGVDFAMNEGVVTLRGVVPSESKRLLAEKLFAIEPGVRGVDNQLVVAAAEVVPAGN